MLDHPIFNDLKRQPRWTISSKKKAPLDARTFIDTWQTEYPLVKYAYTQDAECLVTFEELLTLKDHFNPFLATCFFDVLMTPMLILDIEPSCPEPVRNRLMQLPYVYAETSMSGKGVHLVIPFDTAWFKEFPALQAKKRIQSKDKSFELILQHYITFTGNRLPDNDNPVGQEDLKRFLERFLKDVPETSSTGASDAEVVDLSEIPYADTIVAAVLGEPFKKGLSDYGDHSRYEMAHLCYLANKVVQTARRVESLDFTGKLQYNNNQLLSLITACAKEVIPSRDKHFTRRVDASGRSVPFLTWRAGYALNLVLDGQARKDKNEKTS